MTEVITVKANTLDESHQFREGTAHCPQGKVITGGGFGMPADSNVPLFFYNGPGSVDMLLSKNSDVENGRGKVCRNIKRRLHMLICG